jgi:DNA-binding GntR family transcriptional regulator
MSAGISTERIYEALQETIWSFALYPSSRVSHNQLADYFHLSRTSVREALQRLENDGHLVIKPELGCFIRELNIDELSQYYQVRILVELAIIEQACIKMPNIDLEELAQQWNPVDRPQNLISAQMETLDDAFHGTIADGANSMVLKSYLTDGSNHLRVIRRFGFDNSKRIYRTFTDHYAFILALLRRDTAKARTLIRKHIFRSG